MSKKMCKLAKDNYLDKHIEEYMELIKEPKYVCKKCGRVSNGSDRLCKAKKIK